jgi:hypothetical protein
MVHSIRELKLTDLYVIDQESILEEDESLTLNKIKSK